MAWSYVMLHAKSVNYSPLPFYFWKMHFFFQTDSLPCAGIFLFTTGCYWHLSRKEAKMSTPVTPAVSLSVFAE